jgi:hypothetical protein
MYTYAVIEVRGFDRNILSVTPSTVGTILVPFCPTCYI